LNLIEEVDLAERRRRSIVGPKEKNLKRGEVRTGINILRELIESRNFIMIISRIKADNGKIMTGIFDIVYELINTIVSRVATILQLTLFRKSLDDGLCKSLNSFFITLAMRLLIPWARKLASSKYSTFPPEFIHRLTDRIMKPESPGPKEAVRLDGQSREDASW
jgi:hypothetical protein